jgi:hypothetical protein
MPFSGTRLVSLAEEVGEYSRHRWYVRCLFLIQVIVRV